MALFAVLRFSSVIFSLHPLFLSTVPRAQRNIIYSEFRLWRTHRVFPFVMSLCVQIKLGIMLYLTHNETLSFSAHDNIKCHVRVHLQNKITAFGGPLNSCCTLHLMYYARGECRLLLAPLLNDLLPQ